MVKITAKEMMTMTETRKNTRKKVLRKSGQSPLACMPDNEGNNTIVKLANPVRIIS